MNNRLRLPIIASCVMVAALCASAAPALALKRTSYPEVKVDIAEVFQPDAAFDAMRQAFAAAVASKNAEALFGLVGPTFVWTVDGGATDEFDMGRGPVDNFKAVFGFRAPGAAADGPVEGGPFWNGLAWYAADGTFSKMPDAGNLVCGPIAADISNTKAFEQAQRRLEADDADDPVAWYFTLAETAVTATPDQKAPTVGKVGQVAVPLLSVHPNEEGVKPTHLEVLLPSGKSGWIPAAAARPLVSNRLCYSKTPAGDWKITAFDQNED